MQTVAELIEELKKLPQDDVIDFTVQHAIVFKHYPKKEE